MSMKYSSPDKLISGFIKDYLIFEPCFASYCGYHELSGEWPDYSPNNLEKRKNLWEQYAQQAEEMLKEDLPFDTKIDLKILLNKIRQDIFTFFELKEQNWDPLFYTSNLSRGFLDIINSQELKIEEKERYLLERSKKVTLYLKNFNYLLKVPEIHLLTTLKQLTGLTISIPKLCEIENIQLNVVNEFISGIKEIIEELKNNKSLVGHDFRLGKELYTKKLFFMLESSLDHEEILKRAELELQNVKSEMKSLAEELFPRIAGINRDEKTDIIKTVLHNIGIDHTASEDLLTEISSILGEIEKFVKEKDLVPLNRVANPLVIEWTPKPLRGIAIAGLHPPGVYDKKTPARYMMLPVHEEFTGENQKQAIESFLQEYNRSMLQVLTIHEAIPGHYVQLTEANKNKSIIRKIFWNNAFVEGWAVYSEKMILDSGYKEEDLRVKMMRLKFYLRSILNTIIDQKIHIYNAKKEEIIQFLMDVGLQSQSEAESKWIRACVTSTQLSTYFVGFSELYRLEQEARAILKEKYDQKNFNHTLLHYGSISIPLLEESLQKYGFV